MRKFFIDIPQNTCYIRKKKTEYKRMETFLSADGYEHLLEVSDRGQIRTINRRNDRGRVIAGKLLSQKRLGDLWYVTINKNKPDERVISVHELVATTFYPRFCELMPCGHLDGDPSNNSADNIGFLFIDVLKWERLLLPPDALLESQLLELERFRRRCFHMSPQHRYKDTLIEACLPSDDSKIRCWDYTKWTRNLERIPF